MIPRIAVKLALTSSTEYRWRQLAVPVCAGLALLLLFLGSGVILANQRQAQRNLQRTAIISESPAATDLYFRIRADFWNGAQYLNIWLAPTTGAVEPVLPRGLDRLPRPGEAVVSPALAQLIRGEPLMAERYPVWSLIRPEGVESTDELLAYVGLSPDRLPERTVRIGGFQEGHVGQSGVALGLVALPPASHIIAGVLLLVLLPAALILYLGCAASSGIREHRFSVFHWLGAPTRFMVSISMVETVVLMVPGVLVAIVLWAFVASRLGSFPILSADPLRGDLVLPWSVLTVESVGILLGAAALAAIGPFLIGRRAALRPRPGRSQPSLGRLRMLPIGTAVMLLLLRPWVGAGVSDTFLITAMVFLLVGVPLAAPWLLRRAGYVVAQVHSVPTLLAGRRLAWDPIRNSRPYVAAAILVALMLGVNGYNALAASQVAPPKPPPVSFATVALGLVDDSQIELLRSALKPAIVAVVREEEQTWTIGASCRDLGRHVPDLTCAGDSLSEFGEQGAATMAKAIGLPGQVKIVLSPGLQLTQHVADHQDITGTVPHYDELLLVVDSTRRPAELENLVGSKTIKMLPGSSSVGISRFNRYYAPEVSWVTAGLASAGAILGFATVVSIMDKLFATRTQLRHLIRIGVTESRLRVLEVMLFGVPFLVVVAIGGLVGALSCWLVVSNTTPPTSMPWSATAEVMAAAVAIGLFGSLLVGLSSARASSREDRD